MFAFVVMLLLITLTFLVQLDFGVSDTGFKILVYFKLLIISIVFSVGG